MSEQSQGPGWWLASDGRWYPPDQAPAVPPAETWASRPIGPPPARGPKVGLLVGLGVAVVVLVVALAVVVVVGSDDDPASSTDTGASETTEATTTGEDARAEGDDGGPTGGGPAAELPDGFALLEGDGVTIGAPGSWIEVSPEDFDLTPEQLAETFPDLPEGVVDQFTAMFAQGAVLAAFEPTFAEFAANVNVIDAPGEAPLDVVDAQVAEQLGSLGADDVVTTRPSLPVGEALRVEYTLEVPLADGGTEAARGVQYYVPLDGRTYIITISLGEGADGGLADEMADTFRLA